MIVFVTLVLLFMVVLLIIVLVGVLDELCLVCSI